MGEYWNKELECMPRAEREKLQGQRLVETVQRMWDHVPYYRKKMEEAGLTPADIHGLEDLAKLPFTTKADLTADYPYGAFAKPLSEVNRIHASSGTTGRPTVVGYTEADIAMWADSVARALASLGLSKQDIVHVSYGYGLFTGGLGVHYGVERFGAMAVPASGGNTKRQVQLLCELGATAIACTPSYALYLAEEMEAAGITKDDLKLKVGIFGAEPWTEEMCQEIESKLGIKAYDIYGLSEVCGPGVACDCQEKHGMHIAADNFIPEIVDPETLLPVAEGERGELVFSCVTKEALPLIRYRTKDLTTLDYSPCACGRTTPRMVKVTGRSDDMLIIRGVNVFPSQIESVILKYSEVAPYYQLVVDRIDNLDVLEVQIEMNENFFSDEIRKIEELQRKLASSIYSVLNVTAKVVLVEPKSIPRTEGKAKRIIDKRKKG